MVACISPLCGLNEVLSISVGKKYQNVHKYVCVYKAPRDFE